MKFINYKKKQIVLAFVVGVLLSFNSCGSFQYSGIYDDGIYSESRPTEQVNETVDNTSNSSEYYKNYFKEKSLQIEEDNSVFTDVDSYEGTYANDSENTNNYAGWGENNSSELIINVYNDGPFYGNRWGYNYRNNWGWNFGWNNWGFGLWQPPYYNSWYSPWNDPWYNPYCYYGCYNNFGYFNYGYNRYRGRSYSYINGGRSMYRNSRSLSNRSVLSTTTRSRTNTRSNTRSTTRSTNIRSTTRSTRNNSTTRPTTTRSSNRTTRPNTTTRPTRSTIRSSSPSRTRTRSSSPSRSSSRSSGSSSRRNN